MNLFLSFRICRRLVWFAFEDLSEFQCVALQVEISNCVQLFKDLFVCFLCLSLFFFFSSACRCIWGLKFTDSMHKHPSLNIFRSSEVEKWGEGERGMREAKVFVIRSHCSLQRRWNLQSSQLVYINQHSTAACVFVLFIFLFFILTGCTLCLAVCHRESGFMQTRSAAVEDTNISGENGTVAPPECWLVHGATAASISVESSRWSPLDWNLSAINERLHQKLIYNLFCTFEKKKRLLAGWHPGTNSTPEQNQRQELNPVRVKAPSSELLPKQQVAAQIRNNSH